MITSEQIRAARAMLRMEQTELAQKAGVSVETIKRLEKMDRFPNASHATLSSIKSAFEIEGIIFIEEGKNEDGGFGVRFSGDKSKILMSTIQSEMNSMISAILEAKSREHPDFFLVSSADDISTYCMSALEGYEWMLTRTIKRVRGR